MGAKNVPVVLNFKNIMSSKKKSRKLAKEIHIKLYTCEYIYIYIYTQHI